MKVHHTGIIVKDIEKNIRLYQKLGYILASEIITDDVQNNRIVFLDSSDGTQKLELIEPTNEHSSVYRFSEGYHHICYEANNPDDFLESFRAIKIGKIFTKPMRAPAIDNREVVFGCLSNGVFVEFLF